MEVASWHWIFLINIPFGIIGVMAPALVARDLGPERRPRGRREAGMLLLGGAVFMYTVALTEANPFGGDLPLWLSLMQGAILLGVLFVWWSGALPTR